MITLCGIYWNLQACSMLSVLQLQDLFQETTSVYSNMFWFGVSYAGLRWGLVKSGRLLDCFSSCRTWRQGKRCIAGAQNSQAQWCLMEKYVTISIFTVSVIMCSYFFSSSIFLWSFSALPHVCCYVLPHCPWMCCIWSDAVRDLGDCFAFGASCPHCWSLQLVGTSTAAFVVMLILWHCLTGNCYDFTSGNWKRARYPHSRCHLPTGNAACAIYYCTGVVWWFMMVYDGLAFWKMLLFHGFPSFIVLKTFKNSGRLVNPQRSKKTTGGLLIHESPSWLQLRQRQQELRSVLVCWQDVLCHGMPVSRRKDVYKYTYSQVVSRCIKHTVK